MVQAVQKTVWRCHRCRLWTRFVVPVVCKRQCPGPDAQNAGGAAVAVPRQGVPQVQLLDKILVACCVQRQALVFQTVQKPVEVPTGADPVSVLNTPRFDSGHIGVSLRCFLEEFPSYFNAMLGSIVDTSSCVTLRRMVFLVTMHLALYSFVVLRPLMLVITAGMDQKECYVWPCRKLRIFRSCSSSQVVQFILSLRSGSVSRSRLLDQEIPQLLDKVIEVPVVQDGRVPHVLSWRRPSCSHGCTVVAFVLRSSSSTR